MLIISTKSGKRKLEQHSKVLTIQTGVVVVAMMTEENCGMMTVVVVIDEAENSWLYQVPAMTNAQNTGDDLETHEEETGVKVSLENLVRSIEQNQ